jgi:hypothetical protein
MAGALLVCGLAAISRWWVSHALFAVDLQDLQLRVEHGHKTTVAGKKFSLSPTVPVVDLGPRKRFPQK